MLRGKMEGRGEEVIRKGPWKAEEDEVLLNHVKRYGPRDWSSIRSKGLLQRTGKSCRLRWVNKLRPNLKNGCKFSGEEESVVIELQGQFGNKWAKIATYLPGRTDNDVKNFWSSRQKRLARILQSSATTTTPSKSHKFKKQVSVFHDASTLEDPKLSSSSEGESSSRAALSCLSSSYIDNNNNSGMIKMVPLPDLVRPGNFFNANSYFLQQPQFNYIDRKPFFESQSQFPFPPVPQPPQDLTFSSETQQLMATLDDSYFSDVLGLADFPIFEPVGSCQCSGAGERFDNSVTPDCFFDDFPADMFDQMELLPSTPEN